MDSLSSNWIDAHAHLTDIRIEKELPEIVACAARAGISRFVLGGVDPLEWEKQKRVAQKFPGTFLHSFGLHPWWISRATESEISKGLESLRRELSNEGADRGIAIGETGLDFHSNFSEAVRPVQEAAFRSHLRLAREFGRPLVLHVVRAHERAIAILREEKRDALTSGARAWTGIIHSFSGDLETARAYLDLGLTPSISAPVLTRGRGSAFEKMRETMVTLGATEFVIETDAPDQPPAGESGLNSPLNLLRIADEVAKLRGVTRETILNSSRDTVKRIFKIP